MGLALLLDRKQWGGASAVRKKSIVCEVDL